MKIATPSTRSKRPPKLSLARVVLIVLFFVFAAFCYVNISGAFSSVEMAPDTAQETFKASNAPSATKEGSSEGSFSDTLVVSGNLEQLKYQDGAGTSGMTEVQQKYSTEETPETVVLPTNSAGVEYQQAATSEGATVESSTASQMTISTQEAAAGGTAEEESDSQETVSTEEATEGSGVVDEGVKSTEFSAVREEGKGVVESDGGGEANARFVGFVSPETGQATRTEAATEAVTVPETLAWSGAELLPFYIHDLQSGGKDGSWEKTCANSLPEGFCYFLSASQHQVATPEKAHLFLVPIMESTLYSEKGLYGGLRALVKNRYFMRFRGSDFIFICYTGDCQATEEAILKILGKAVRAIWVDRGSESRWPCSNRRIPVESDGDRKAVLDWVAEGARVERVLTVAKELIDGRARWSCEGMPTWGYEHFQIHDFGNTKYTSNKSVKDKVAFCGIPKVGSSVTVLLMRRMNGMKHWKAENTVQIRNFDAKVDWTYQGQSDVVRIFNQTEWVKGVMVRNPITRLLSGYKSKIEQIREYGRIPGGWPKGASPPTFEQFIQRVYKAKAKGHLDWIDIHFRPQAASCSLRTIPYDFIAHYESRQDDFYYFLKSLGRWEELGESGWGPSGLSSLYGEDEGIVRKNKPKPVTHADSKEVLKQYYTRDLVKTVMKLYAEDFERFGYSTNVDDYVDPPQ